MNLTKKIIDKKYTIDEVLNTGVIHCKAKQELIKLFKTLSKHGYKWASGEELLENLSWNEYKTETCVDIENGKVYITNIGYYVDYQPYLRIYTLEELVLK